MRFALTLSLLCAFVALPLAAQAKPEFMLGFGPGYIPAARDADGSNEGVQYYVDFAGRINDQFSAGMRDAPPPTQLNYHDLSLWGRADLLAYSTNTTIPFVRIAYGGVMIPAGSARPDFTNSQWTIAWGVEVKQSKLWSLIYEGNATYGVVPAQVVDLGIKAGALFRFGNVAM